jgi:hypothetical protein
VGELNSRIRSNKKLMEVGDYFMCLLHIGIIQESGTAKKEERQNNHLF